MSNDVRTRLEKPPEKREEIKVFLLLTAVIAPLLTVGIVGGYGLIVWIYQHFTGPPTY